MKMLDIRIANLMRAGVTIDGFHILAIGVTKRDFGNLDAVPCALLHDPDSQYPYRIGTFDADGKIDYTAKETTDLANAWQSFTDACLTGDF